MKRFICLLLILCILLTGCTGYTAYPVVINDAVIKKVPSSVIAFDEYTYYNLSSLGFTDKIVGDIADFGTALYPNVQALTALGADILISSAPLPEEETEKITSSGTVVIIIQPVETLEDITKNYIDYYRIMLGNDNAETAGETIIDYIDSEINYIKSGVYSGDQLLIEMQNPSFVATKDTFLGEIISACGLKNASVGKNWFDESKPVYDIKISADTVNIKYFESECIGMFKVLRNEIVDYYGKDKFTSSAPILVLSYDEPKDPTIFQRITQFWRDVTR